MGGSYRGMHNGQSRHRKLTAMTTVDDVVLWNTGIPCCNTLYNTTSFSCGAYESLCVGGELLAAEAVYAHVVKRLLRNVLVRVQATPPRMMLLCFKMLA